MKKLIFGLFIIGALLSCTHEDKVLSLLKSDKKVEQFEGTYRAGLSGDKKYVPILLINMNDPSLTHDLRWKGMSLYRLKINALKKILLVEPPNPYRGNEMPDSINIRFYNALWLKTNKPN